MGWTYVPILFNPLHPNAVFNWPVLPNPDGNDLIAAGFFHTGEVLHKPKPVYYK
jgi:hypothetical protein